MYCCTKNVICCLLVTLTVFISSCTTPPEKKILFKTDVRPQLGLRLRVISTDGWPETIVGNRSNLLRVVDVKKGQPSDRAGIKHDDIILSIDEQPVSGMADSVALVQRHRWGDVVLINIVRDQSIHRIPVLLSNSHTDSVEKIFDHPTTDERDTDSYSTSSTLVPVTLDQRIVLGQNTNLREKPSIASNVLTQLDLNTIVNIKEDVGEWIHVITTDSKRLEGYVHTSLLGEKAALYQ